MELPPFFSIKLFIMIIKEVFEDTKGVIRIRKSKKRQHNGQKKTEKQRSTKHTHKIGVSLSLKQS